MLQTISRVALLLGATALFAACTVESEAPSDPAAIGDLDQVENLDQSEDAFTAAQCQNGICEDAAEAAHAGCLSDGYPRPKNGCAGPERPPTWPPTQTNPPRWCAGINELCGTPQVPCRTRGCVNIDPVCAAQYTSLLEPTCDTIADNLQTSCEAECAGSPPPTLPAGRFCIAVIPSTGEVVIGTIGVGGWCNGANGSSINCDDPFGDGMTACLVI